MNNKGLIVAAMLLIVILTLFISVDQYIKNTYGLSLYQYMVYSSPMTEVEKQYLSEKKTIYFVSDNNAPPFAYIDSDSRQYKGLVLDYASALSIELGVEIKFVPKEWEAAVNSLANGYADVCDMFSSAERRKYFIFSDPIYRLRAIVLTRKGGGGILQIKDLSEHSVAIPAGDYAIEYIRNNIRNVNIVETPDIHSSIIALLDGTVDAVIGDEPVIMYFTNEMEIDDRVNVLHPPLYEKDVSLAINKANTKLLHILNKGIFHLKQKDFIQKIQQKWFGLSVPIQKDRIPDKVLIGSILIMVSLLLVVILTSLWSYTLKSEVKRRTEELNKSRHDLQMTFDALSDLLIVVDKEGNIIDANKSFCDWVKSNKCDVIGRNYEEFPLLKYICGLYDIYKSNGKDIGIQEISFNGRYYSISMAALEYGNDKLLLAADDVTDRKISQQGLIQQNKMIAVGQLAAGVAHEIRNPLGLIRNYSYILKNRIEIKDPIFLKSINAIEASVFRAGEIVDNLLNFSRVSDDRWQHINLKETIQKLILLENKILSEKNIEVKLSCEKSIIFYTKRESLNHIMLNLLSNSADAMPKGGIISIDCYVEEGLLYMEFKDTGTGISSENLEYIFNPFFTTKKTGGGTGLGLYIVYNEVQKIGGEISVESALDEGTLFKLKFPPKEVN